MLNTTPAPHVTADDLPGLLAERGRRIDTRLYIADGMLDPITAPLCVITGSQPGPTLYLGAGLHGNEYNTIEIAWRLLAEIDPAALHGSIISIPVQNPPGFAARMRGIQTEQWIADTNRPFPGSLSGSIDAVLAQRLLQVASQANVVIDLHTSSEHWSYLPLGYVPPAEATHSAALALTAACGVHLMYPAVAAGSLVDATSRRGIVSTIIEMGAGQILEAELITAGVAGIRNALRHLGILSEPVQPTQARLASSDFTTLRAPRSGFLHLTDACTLGAQVTAGTVLALLHTYPDGLQTPIIAPHDGLLVQRPTASTVVQAGDRLIRIAQFAQESATG